MNMVNMVNFICQIWAYSSKHHCKQAQPHKVACAAVLSVVKMQII